MSMTCPKCGGTRLRHSRLKSWMDRARWRTTARVPLRCRACQARSWHRDIALPLDAPHQVHPDLTEYELERLDPDRAGGDPT